MVEFKLAAKAQNWSWERCALSALKSCSCSSCSGSWRLTRSQPFPLHCPTPGCSPSPQHQVPCIHSLPLPPAAKITLWNPVRICSFLAVCSSWLSFVTPSLLYPPLERPRPPTEMQTLCHLQGFAHVWHAAGNAVPRGLTLLLCLPSELQSSLSLTQMPHTREPSWPSLLV